MAIEEIVKRVDEEIVSLQEIFINDHVFLQLLIFSLKKSDPSHRQINVLNLDRKYFSLFVAMCEMADTKLISLLIMTFTL